MKRILFAIIVGVLAAACTLLIKRHNDKTLEQVRAAETGVEPFDAKDLKSRKQKAEAHWQDAAKALRAHDLPGAFKAYFAARTSVESLVLNYADKEVAPGVTVKQWDAQQFQSFRAALLEDCAGIFDGLASGDVDPQDVKQPISHFAQYGLNELDQRFKEQEPLIIEARARAARNWVRVDLRLDAPEYRDTVVSALKQKVEGRYGRKVVFGYALGPAETRATWKTMVVQLRQRVARYELQGKKRGEIIMPELPESVEVQINLEGTSEVPTSWDRLEPVRAKIDPPETLWVKLRDSTTEVRADTIKQKKQQELLEALAASLAALPEFKVFPGVEPATVQVRQGNTLAFNSALALGYLDLPRLVAQLNELVKVPAFDGEVALLVASLELDAFASWLAQRLPALDWRLQEPIFRELKKHPWFGEYEPLLVVLAKAKQDYPGLAVDALHAQAHVPKVKAAFLQKTADPVHGANYAGVFIAVASPEEIRQHAPAWLNHTNDYFVRAAFNAIANRDRRLAGQLTLDLFDQVPERTQDVLLERFEFSEQEREAGYKILGASLRAKNKLVRDTARTRLLNRPYEPEAWDLLRDLAAVEADPRRKQEIEQKLIHNVRRAYPQNAQQYLVTQLDNPVPHLRDSAIHTLVYQDDPSPELFRALAERIAAQPGDRPLLKTVVAAIHQHHRLRRGWKFDESQSDLKTILQTGARDADPQVRRASYTVMGYALSKGATHYAGALKAAEAAETDPQLRRELAQHTAKVANAK